MFFISVSFLPGGIVFICKINNTIVLIQITFPSNGFRLFPFNFGTRLNGWAIKGLHCFIFFLYLKEIVCLQTIWKAG